MQLVLNLISSVSIRRKKPWPKLTWIGQEQDGLYLLDGKRISQLYIPSGKTKRKISKLHGLMNDVCALNVSQNGQFLCGALYDGKIFLWEKDKDKIQFITGLPKIFNDADKVDDSHNIIGTWSQVHHGEYCLPNQSNKEATVDGVFYSDEVIGRCGSFSYVFNKGTELAVTTLIVKSHGKMRMSNLTHNIPNQDDETASREVVEKMRCSIKWKSTTRPLYGITPATRLVKGRFVYGCRYSPDGQMLAIVLNQKLAKNTRLLFCSTLHQTSSVADMKCCGGSDLSSGRTWWVCDITWTPDSLLLIGITRNGALFITTKLGEPINLITTGCGMDLGPSLFLTLHPRITVKSFQENIPPENSEISSGSEKDIFHQKFSVAVHPWEPFLLCSDGYMVTIFDFNAKPDYSKLITDLTEDVSLLLASDATSHKLEEMPGNLETNVCSMSMASTLLSKLGKDVSELSSPGSTLSETAKGYGIARNAEAGAITFGGTEVNVSVEVEEMTDHQKALKAEGVLLQGLGIGASCGPHWSQNMPAAMNLAIHTWVKLFRILLDDERNCGVSNDDTLFHNIITFVQSCFEAFRWDIAYQHCLPWFTQFVHSTVKCLVCSKKFCSQEIIDICMKLLRMAEEFLFEIYAWFPVSDSSTVHFLGDSFSPSYETPVLPISRNSTMGSGDKLSDGDLTRNINLDCKLEQAWLTLYHYVCKIYKSNCKTGTGENYIPDEKLAHDLCWIQKKLQASNLSKNLFSAKKMESLSNQGYKMYLDGRYSQAASLLEKSFYESSKDIHSRETKDFIKSDPLDLNLRGTSSTGRPLGSRSGTSLIEDDFSLKLSADIETLLSILYINLESYDLKAALALVYSFIDTTRGVNLQDLLNPETRYEGRLSFIAADDAEVKVTSSSSLMVMQLSVLVKYPLAWVVDNCAIPVVQQLARFMACYFTNLPLTIPTPFHSQKLVNFREDSGTIPKAHSSATNVKNLSQQRLTEAIGQQKLESLWTADHTMELLLMSGLLGEAAWFANRLGDWRIAFLLSVTEVFRKTNQSYVEKRSHGHSTLPIEVPQPEQLIKERIKMILKLDGSITELDVEGTREMFDDEHIFNLQNVLEACVITELNLVPIIIKQLVEMLKESISKLDWIVAQDLYLPAPPLYCPQPARNDGDVLNEGTRKEIFLRAEIANIVQKILAIYKASSCFLHCAQQYCKHLVRNFSDSLVLPNIINEFITTEGSHIDTREDEDLYSGVIRSFQEFCGLMWSLDVRNELALASRRYSKLKQNLSLVPDDDQRQDVISQCEVVIVWLKRLMPFSEFLNASDDLLDSILTLLSELPMNCETVDLLAQYFHTLSPATSLPTTDKLNRMTRKIRNIGEHIGVENGESLSVRFQEQCEKRRMEAKTIFSQPCVINFLELIPTFCTSLDYERDFAFLRFLDTFLLITLAKTITSEDYKKVPLIFPYKDRPTLEAEISSIEATTRGQERHTKKSSLGIQRSQSFQDVGNVKKKSENGLLSPDGLDSNGHSPVNRSNSLTDLRRIQSSNLSEELQTFLPTLLWLKRWCLSEECQRGNQGTNKSFSFLNVTTTPTAIRIRLPLELVVNTLWLDENYYKDFSEAKGRCVRDKTSRVRMKKKSRKKENLGKDVVVEESEQKADGQRPLAFEVREENEKVVEGESQVLEKVKRRRLRRPRDTHRKGQTPGKSEREIREPEQTENLRMEKESDEVIQEIREMEESPEGNKVTMKGELPELMLRSKKRAGNHVSVSHVGDQKEEGLDSQNVDESKPPMCVDQSNELEGSVDYLNQYDQVVNRDLQDSRITETVLNQKDEEKVSDQDFIIEGSGENISKKTEIKRTLFSSPTTSSSEGSKWKSLESVDANLPFSFTLLDDGKNISGGKIRHTSPNTIRMMSDFDFSNVAEAGMISTFPRHVHDDDVSLTSESLSIGQIRSQVAVPMKVAANVNSDTSVETTTKDKVTKHRKATKRKIYDETTSCESLEKPRVKSKDDGSLLRRIIRSEMKKFIKAQQTEIRSQSSSMRTTDENICDEISKNEVHKTKGRKSRVNRKNSQERFMSNGKNRGKDRGKTNEDFRCRSSQPPMRDTQRQSRPTYRRPMRDHGTIYQGPSAEDDTSCSDHRTRLHVSATATKHCDNVQTAHQVFPPFINERQFPTVSGWPLWYNPPFSAPAPWLWPNSAPKVNSDKGVQVDDTRKDEITEDNTEVIKRSLVVDSPLADHEDEVPNDIKDKIISVAVQTDVSENKLETSLKGDLDHKESNAMKDTPFLLSLNDHSPIRNKNQAKEKVANVVENKPSPNKEQVSSSTNYQEELFQPNDVFPQALSAENSQHVKIGEINHVPATMDDDFTIPLLKFSNDVHIPAPQSLPFKIAWPEYTDVDPSERMELPLLQLSKCSEKDEDIGYLSIPEPLPNSSNRHFENAPLFHFSYQNDVHKNLSDFCFVQVPENENFEFPLLYLLETGVNPSNGFSEESYAEDPKKGKLERKRMQTGISDTNFVGNVGETSKAKIKRRNRLAGSVKPLSNQISSESPSSELEIQNSHITAVHPSEKLTRRNDKSKTTKPRRDKLRELNNIIRDLQRDVTNDDDLLVSEVSSILSPEIRYENFETKPEVKRHYEVPHASKNTKKLPPVLGNVRKDEGRDIDHNTSIDQKPTVVSRLYQPSTVAARDIHTEIPTDIPEQSMAVDAKVGTVNILRFPASVQTDTVVPRPDTFNDLPASPRRSETRELSIQTEPELKKLPVSSSMQDAAVNTENILEERKDESNSGITLYPRVPADVYLDIRDINEKPSETTLPSTRRDSVVNIDEKNEPRTFLSVVDIAGDDMGRQMENEDEKVKESKDNDYLQTEAKSIKKDLDIKNDIPDVSMPTTATGIEKGDETTAAVFSSMYSPRSSSNQPASRGNSRQHAQKISKEKLSQRLLEMNEQFDAIEQLTSNMEQDLQWSNRLLRTIENISKVTEHVPMPKIDKQKKAVDRRVGETHETAGTGRLRKLSDDMNFQHDKLNGGELEVRRKMHNGVLQEDKKSLIKSPPWINKPIEQLTDLDDRAVCLEERSLDDSLEKSQEKKETKHDAEDMSDASVHNRPDAVSNLRNDVGNPEDFLNLEEDKDTMWDVTNTVNSLVDSMKLVNPERSGSGLRFKPSLSPEDVLNVSREKLKEILAGKATSAYANSSRDKTPQKQQELREWMTKKRKLRHKEWTQNLNENRQKEFKPFQSKIQGEQTSLSSKKLKISEKERKNNRRAQAKEHVDERLLSAYDLMNEMVTEHAPKRPALITQNSIRNTQPKTGRKTARVKANNRYKENRPINNKTSKKKPTAKTSLKASSELYGTQTVPGQVGLTGLGNLVDNKFSIRHSSDAPVYEYDIQESGKQFITRKSYESYKQKMSASFDYDRSLSLRRESPLTSQLHLDPRVDELLEDVSLGDPTELQRLDNLDSLLSGDSELRDLLGDVIADKRSRGLLETRDDVMSTNSRTPQNEFPSNVGSKWRDSSSVVGLGTVLNTFKVDGEVKNWLKRQDSYERSPEEFLSVNEEDNLEMSDEVAALLAEAKAAVGDDFSGTSEVGDIDWNEVDQVLQQN